LKKKLFIYQEPFPVAAKKVISSTDRAAEKHVQNSVCMPCKQSPEIKLMKNSLKKFSLYALFKGIYLSGAVPRSCPLH